MYTGREAYQRTSEITRLWFRIRAGRVTASKLHQVCHTKPAQPAPSLIAGVRSQNTTCRPTQAMQCGTDHEDTARTCYEKKQAGSHADFTVRKSGLILNPKYLYMAASPDGLCQCTCCHRGCLEVECSFNEKQMITGEALSLPNFPLHTDGRKFH